MEEESEAIYSGGLMGTIEDAMEEAIYEAMEDEANSIEEGKANCNSNEEDRAISDEEDEPSEDAMEEPSGPNGDSELGEQQKQKRKSYCREMKLSALQYFHECNNKYKTANKFGVSGSTFRGWLKNETRF